MKYWLSFCGYPRSGHTLIAAILNANPNIMCSNQLNVYADVNNFNLKHIKDYSKIEATWKDTTQVEHVPKQEILVVGDKTGHRTVVELGKNPQRLAIFKQIIQVPIKWIHVVRNPWDNCATWAKLNFLNKKKQGKPADQHKELDSVIQKYRDLNVIISRLRRSEDVLTVNHEHIMMQMHNTLELMANFLEVSFDPDWRMNVRKTVWDKPRITRTQVSWSGPQKNALYKMTEQYEWLDGYDYGIGGCSGCGK